MLICASLSYEKALSDLEKFFCAHKHVLDKFSQDLDPWIYYKLKNEILPLAGWKIHISSSVKSLDYIINNLIIILRKKIISFKICKNFEQYMLMNQGFSGETQIGKTITLYPSSKEEALKFYSQIKNYCQDPHAPKIPADLYFDPKDSISFRYGQFEKEGISYDTYGAEKAFIPNEKGELIEDKRSLFGAQKSTLVFNNQRAHSLPLAVAKPQQKYIIFAHKKYEIIRNYGRPNKGVLLLKDLESKFFITCKFAQKNTGSYNFKNEFSLLQELKEKISCPKPLFMLEEDYFFYLFLSDVGGDSLEKLPLFIAQKFFSDLIDLIQSLHALGIVHRDLKLENFILNIKQKKLALIDFELAQRHQSLITHNAGTPGFFAPQKNDDKALYEHDFYALAAILAGLAADINPSSLRLEPADLAQWLCLNGFGHIARWVKKLCAPRHDKNFLEKLKQEAQQPDFFLARTNKLVSPKLPKLDNLSHKLKPFYREVGEKIFWRNAHPSLNYEHQGINIGSSGIIIALHSLYKFSKKNSYKNLLLRTAHGLASQKPFEHAQGFFTGNAGVALALAVASQYDISNYNFKQASLSRLKLASKQKSEFDLFFGAAGVLYAGIIISDIFCSQEIFSIVNNLGEILYNNIIDYEGVYSWPAPQILNKSAFASIGISHGALGSAMAMGLWASRNKNDEARMLSIEVYKKVYENARTKNGSYLRYDVHKDSPGRAHHLWCHGTGGFLWGLLNLNPSDQEIIYLSEALSWALDKYLASSLPSNPTMCHGLAGDLELALLLRQSQFITSHTELLDHRISAISTALSLLQRKKSPFKGLWCSEDASIVCGDLWVGSLGPSAVLAQHALGSYKGIFSPLWLKSL